MRVWQIGAGETGRDYRELFFDYDVMLLGPSDLGNALSNSYAFGPANSDYRQVHSFAHNPKPRDRVLMRFAKDIIGVGEIPADESSQYSFDKRFGCVYGWHLSHCRRVTWVKVSPHAGLAKVFRNIKQKPSFCQVHEPHIVERVRRIDGVKFDRPLKEMPDIDSSEYTDEELGVALFRAGISNKNIEDIVSALHQADRLCGWYRAKDDACGNRPTEHEVVSHVILPLFLGLGWSHQQIAVEWKHIDMAFFRKTPTVEKNCVMVLEAKGLGTALAKVLEQPKRYVERYGMKKNVKYLLTTDGADIFVYDKSYGQWRPNPVGYISVWSLRKQYIVPKGTSLVDTLVRLQPSAL